MEAAVTAAGAGPGLRMTQTVIMCTLVSSPEVMKHYNGRMQAGTPPRLNEHIKGHKYIYERGADGEPACSESRDFFSDRVGPWAVVWYSLWAPVQLHSRVNPS